MTKGQFGRPNSTAVWAFGFQQRSRTLKNGANPAKCCKVLRKIFQCKAFLKFENFIIIKKRAQENRLASNVSKREGERESVVLVFSQALCISTYSAYSWNSQLQLFANLQSPRSASPATNTLSPCLSPHSLSLVRLLALDFCLTPSTLLSTLPRLRSIRLQIPVMVFNFVQFVRDFLLFSRRSKALSHIRFVPTESGFNLFRYLKMRRPFLIFKLKIFVCCRTGGETGQ